MKKLLLSVVLALVTLTTFAQGKEKVFKFSKIWVEVEEDKKPDWTEDKGKLIFYPKGENKVVFHMEHGEDTFTIESVTKEVDGDGRKRERYLVKSPNGTPTVIYLYKKKKYGVTMYLTLLGFNMHLK